jgi:hypothetical protein
MTSKDEALLRALCDPVSSTSEAVGFFGVDMLALAVPKPSRPDRDPETIEDNHEPARR